jgi:ATP-dependent Clp protease ATP-binding subunit ClpA
MDEMNVAMTAREVLKHARDAASTLSSRTVEAEHLLLVLADQSTENAGKVLQEAGLDRGRIEAALREENRLSLAVAGVEPLTDGQASASRQTRTPLWGASAKAALVRGHRVAKQSGRVRETTTDLLLGILQAELGTVPRALAIAGADRAELMARLGPAK